jgi:hypothetical protein
LLIQSINNLVYILDLCIFTKNTQHETPSTWDQDVVVLLLAVAAGNPVQNVAAQKPDTFTAKRYTGQTFALPSGISQFAQSQTTQKPPVGSVIGGNWSLGVSGGSVKDF